MAESVRLLWRGAEAELFVLGGRGKRLLKRRVAKDYRCRELDECIRSTRTVLEARLLGKARKIGVKTPRVLRVDKDRKEIEMEFVEGSRVKDVLSDSNFDRVCFEIGENIAKMHAFDLIHGDLTTSNIIIHNNCLFFIDFGLGGHSRKMEDKAVDLLVFKKTFEATHADLMPRGWERIIQGYVSVVGGDGERIVHRIGEIEKRARYH